MAYVFDGPTRTIQLSAAASLDVVDLYSRWKDWVLESDHSKWPAAFSVTGGDTVDPGAGTSVPAYYFLENGWRVRPQEADHTLAVTTGILLVSGGGDPFLDTLGDYTVRVNYQQPVQAITVATGGGGLTAGQALMLTELYRLAGLDPTRPLVVTTTARNAGVEIAQAISEVVGTVTVQRA